MQISFTAQRRDDELVAELISADRIRINGELFNFGPLNEGDIIPRGSIPCEWIDGPVERKDGVICLTLLLPYKIGLRDVDAPVPITVDIVGVIDLPNLDPEPEEEAANVDA